ncbi:MAG: hypothetical protein RIQ56_773, partial [Candidatus Parcubacteria bacterium]
PTDNAHGVQIAKTCEAMAKAGGKVTLVRPWRFNKMKGDIFDHYNVERNFKVVTLPSIDISILGWLGFWIQMLSFAKIAFWYVLIARPDVVYSRDEVPLYFASWACRNVVWESHSGRFNVLVDRLIKSLKLLVVITKGGADFYAEKGMPRERIHVAPDAVSLEDFAHPESKEAARKRLGLPLDKKIALYIGKLDGWKGAETFCAASEFAPEVLFAAIGGEPHEISALKAKYPKVTFLGWRPYSELPDNQQAGDVLVLPNTAKSEISVRFTSPLKLFTYMASGVPIVASDLPSIREVLDDSSAYFATPDDPTTIARAIFNVISEGRGAFETSDSAKRLTANFTWKVRGKRIVQSIENVISA